MFNKIDVSVWERREHYEHFMNRLRCNYSMTVNIDITELLSFIKERKIRLYPAMIYIFSIVVNNHREFRMAHNAENAIGYFDICHPSYTIFNDKTKTFSGIWAKCDTSFSTFFENYLCDLADYSDTIKYAPKDNQPENTFYVSNLPWTSFAGLTVQIHDDGLCLTPRITMGKYFEENGKTMLPVAVEFHHAVCDGYHASLFFSELQTLSNSSETVLI